MANIIDELNIIRQGRYGRDIREAIAEALRKINEEVSGSTDSSEESENSNNN